MRTIVTSWPATIRRAVARGIGDRFGNSASAHWFVRVLMQRPTLAYKALLGTWACLLFSRAMVVLQPILITLCLIAVWVVGIRPAPFATAHADTGSVNIRCHMSHALVTAPVPGYRSIRSSSGLAPTISKAHWQTLCGLAPVRPFCSVMDS